MSESMVVAAPFTEGRVLVCVPDLEKSGGVASYYSAVRRHLGDGVEYFTRGSRHGERGGLRMTARMLGDYRRFIALLGSPEIRVVHVNTSFAARGVLRDAIFVLLAKVRRRRVLLFLRGWDQAFERGMDRPLARVAVRALFRADRILVLSERFTERLREWGYRGEITTESTAVDEDLVAAASGEYREARDGSPSAPTILFLARLEADKGVFVAVDAFRLLQARHPDARLLVAGDGSARDALTRYVAERSIRNVEFLGYVRGRQKAEAFQRATLYLFPTTHGEGMPNSVLEAMAFGLPVVTRRVGGLADFFRDGEMGLATEATDPETFADLLDRLIEAPELRKRMSSVNREYAAERFAAPRVAGRLAAVYRELLRN